MKTIASITLLTFMLSLPLFAVKSGSYTIKQNTAGKCGSACGSAFSESFNQSYNDAIRRQRDLEQYEKMLEIQYRAQMKAQKELDQYQRQLDE